MPTTRRPQAAFLLVVLLLAWGPCPGSWGLSAHPAEAVETADAAPTCGCGCCRNESEAPHRAPVDEDCPYCSRHGGRAQACLLGDAPAAPAPAPASLPALVPPVVEVAALLPARARFDAHALGPPPPAPPRTDVLLL